MLLAIDKGNLANGASPFGSSQVLLMAACGVNEAQCKQSKQGCTGPQQVGACMEVYNAYSVATSVG